MDAQITKKCLGKGKSIRLNLCKISDDFSFFSLLYVKFEAEKMTMKRKLFWSFRTLHKSKFFDLKSSYIFLKRH